MNIVDKLSRQNNESPKEFQIRICKNRKEYDLTWDEVGHILNEEFDENKSESVYRKWWYAFSDGCVYTNNMYREQAGKAPMQYDDNEDSVSQVELELLGDDMQASTIKVKLTAEQKKDKNYLLKVHGYDPMQWEIVSAKQSIWNQSANKGKDIIDLYSSKITVKPRRTFEWNKENIEKLFSELGKDRAPVSRRHVTIQDENLLVIPLADIHYGLMATEELAGEEYNIEIATERVYYVIDDILERIKGRDISKILLLIGNDGINADNINGTTTKGTQLDNQADWFSTVRGFTDLMINIIDKLVSVAPISVYFVPSNHDFHTTWGVTETLKAYYRNDSEIEIINEATQRKYFVYGQNMIGFSHDEKDKNISKIMAAESPEAWGKTKYKYFLVSHLHHEIVKDDFGVDIRRLPTISGRSYWANKCGFVGTKKQSQAFIFSPNKGLTDVINTIIID